MARYFKIPEIDCDSFFNVLVKNWIVSNWLYL